MNNYSAMERSAARFLERFPKLRRVAKASYRTLSYWLHREGGFRAEIHPEVRLTSAFEWAGLPDRPARDGAWFFGYFDKSPWPEEMDRALLHHRTGEWVEVVVLDRQTGSLNALGRTKAWNWQQGAMAQWLPLARGSEVVYNDTQGQLLGCRIAPWDQRGEGTFIPWPVQTVHPDGLKAISLNYLRLARLRPEYGYPVEAINFRADQPLDRDGLWLADLTTGKAELMISLAQLAEKTPAEARDQAEHKVNHALFSPSGDRLVFMHRWLLPDGKHSRLYLVNTDGSGLKLLLDHRLVSHYHWRGEDQVVVYGRTEAGDGYYLVEVDSGRIKPVAPRRLDLYGDGHCSFSRDGYWLVTDSYPDKARQQHLFIYLPAADELIEVGRFLAPNRFEGLERCDLHPRFSWDGRLLAIDSSHSGTRRTYFLDVSTLVKK